MSLLLVQQAARGHAAASCHWTGDGPVALSPGHPVSGMHAIRECSSEC